MFKSLKVLRLFLYLLMLNIIFMVNTMADDTKLRTFIEEIDKVKANYSEDSLQFRIPSGFIATVAAAETGNLEFENAPTAKAANNFFGIHPYGEQEYLATLKGAKLRKFNSVGDSIAGFLDLIATQDEYQGVRDAIEQGDSIENYFKGMSKYAARDDYPAFLNKVYKSRIHSIVNPILPKRKPINLQMNSLK